MSGFTVKFLINPDVVFFVDLGAFDGVFLSNTYLLEKRYGWKGICIEANIQTYEKLVRHRSGICVNALVSDVEAQAYISNAGTVSSIVPPGDFLDSGVDKNIFAVRSLPLIRILQEHHAPACIDYMSVDIEGAEDMALLGFDFDQYMFRCMTIELPSQELKAKLAKNGYCLVKEIPGLDSFCIHQSFMDVYRENVHKIYMDYRRIRSQ
jgi:FkbM family methyltransferase